MKELQNLVIVYLHYIFRATQISILADNLEFLGNYEYFERKRQKLVAFYRLITLF